MSENSKKEILSKEELKKTVQKRKKKKMILISAIFAAAVILAACVGLMIWQIIRVKPIKRTNEQKQVVGQVGKYDVYYDEFSYLVHLHGANAEYKYGNIDWSSDSYAALKYTEYVQNNVLEDIEKNYTVLTLCEKYGIDTDSKAINKEVNEKIKQIIKTDFNGKKSEYASWLEKNGLSDAFYRLVLKVNLLEEDMLEKLIEDGDVIKYSIKNYKDFVAYAKSDNDFIRTTHIYYPKSYRYKEVDVAQNRADAKAAVETLRAIASNSDRYKKMNDLIGNCPYIVDGYTMSTLDGVYFTPGMMGKEYENAAFALDEYGVSDVLETEDGFYVIMRLPKEASYIDKNADTLLANYQAAQLVLLEREVSDGLVLKCDDIAALIKKELTK